MNASVAKWNMIATWSPCRRNRYPIARPATATGAIFQSPYPGPCARPNTIELARRKSDAGRRTALGDFRLMQPPSRYRREPARYAPRVVPAGRRPFAMPMART